MPKNITNINTTNNCNKLPNMIMSKKAMRPKAHIPRSPEYIQRSPEYTPRSPEYTTRSPEYIPSSPEYKLDINFKDELDADFEKIKNMYEVMQRDNIQKRDVIINLMDRIQELEDDNKELVDDNKELIDDNKELIDRNKELIDKNEYFEEMEHDFLNYVIPMQYKLFAENHELKNKK
jgi:hypothetical protein